ARGSRRRAPQSPPGSTACRPRGFAGLLLDRHAPEASLESQAFGYLVVEVADDDRGLRASGKPPIDPVRTGRIYFPSTTAFRTGGHHGEINQNDASGLGDRRRRATG